MGSTIPWWLRSERRLVAKFVPRRPSPTTIWSLTGRYAAVAVKPFCTDSLRVSRTTKVLGNCGMDILEILHARIDALPDGDHIAGLKAVLQHVSVASRHHERGAAQGDDTAFTDAIYRCNQAFEGSLKEAYRVLAAKDPMKVRPYDIETFFEEGQILRPRVLAQFSTYRKEWRNPSAHDYRLDFNEDVALLAIVSVCAFAIVLCDQVAERLSFIAAETAISPGDVIVPQPAEALLDVVSRSLEPFQVPAGLARPQDPMREAEVVGAIGGHLKSSIPGLEVVRDPMFASGDQLVRPDLLVRLGAEDVVIEVNRASGRWLNVLRRQFLEQGIAYVRFSGAAGALVYAFGDGAVASSVREDAVIDSKGTRVVILRPPSTSRPAKKNKLADKRFIECAGFAGTLSLCLRVAMAL